MSRYKHPYDKAFINNIDYVEIHEVNYEL